MPNADVILATLQLVADRHGDPTPAIYARLFAERPDLERLFAMDRNGDVRASMVQQAFECILDYVGPRLTAPSIIASSRNQHEGYGVPTGAFDLFFPIMRDTFRDLLADAWTPDMETEWRKLTDALTSSA
jgi:hemoglobin-like flavoprotein